jgi:predicted metal-dependent phosphoesterase TrpH
VVAVTDHERPDTIGELQRLATSRGVRVLPGVEMSSLWEGELLDILCFGIHSGPNELADIAADTRRRQLENVHAAYTALQRNGFQFPRACEVLASQAGEPRQLDDLITLMESHSHTDGMGKALRDAGFAWMTADPGAIVAAAHAQGALALIAHPGRGDGFVRLDPDKLDHLRATVPIDGIEARHPTHTSAQVEEFLQYARTYDLLTSAGSDSHGPPGTMPIKYPAETCRALLERLGVVVGRHGQNLS